MRVYRQTFCLKCGQGHAREIRIPYSHAFQFELETCPKCNGPAENEIRVTTLHPRRV